MNILTFRYTNILVPDKFGKIGNVTLGFDTLEDYFYPVDRDIIPTDEIRSVEITAFDFRKDKKVGRDFATHKYSKQSVHLIGISIYSAIM